MAYQVVTTSFDFHTNLATAVLTEAGNILTITFSLSGPGMLPFPDSTPKSNFDNMIKLGARRALFDAQQSLPT